MTLAQLLLPLSLIYLTFCSLSAQPIANIYSTFFFTFSFFLYLLTFFHSFLVEFCYLINFPFFFNSFLVNFCYLIYCSLCFLLGSLRFHSFYISFLLNFQEFSSRSVLSHPSQIIINTLSPFGFIKKM